MNNTFDVMIIGAGITGLTTALRLAQHTSLSVALLDAAPLASLSGHSRVSAITLASKKLFETVSVWQSICETPPGHFEKMAIFTEDNQLTFDSCDVASPCLGYIIDNARIQKSLLERAATFQNLHLFVPINITSLTQEENQMTLHAADHSVVSAKLLIAADGARSWIRETAKINIEKKDYKQSAIVATIQTEKKHQHVARQWFEKNKILAFLPLADEHLISIVWSLPTDTAHHYHTMDAEKFISILLAETRGALGELRLASERQLYPLFFQSTTQYVKNRIVLVGDAAHLVHPLAGLGVNMGLQDVATLTSLIIDAHHTHSEIASHSLLRKYERARKAENQPFLFGIDFIKSFFTASNGSVMKKISMQFMNRCAPLKSFFMRSV